MSNTEKEIALKLLKEEYDHAKAQEQEWEQAYGDPIRDHMTTYYRGKAEALHFAIHLLEK